MAHNEDNLKPYNKDDAASVEKARENGRKGGIESGKSKRRRKDLKLALEMLLEKDFTDKNGNKITGTEAITTKLFEQAMKGNVKAFETIRATVGQDPVQKVAVADVEQSVIDEVERIVLSEDD